MGVLLLDLGHVLKLDGLAFEHVPFHVLDVLFLLLTQLVVPQLHPVDFFAHGYDLSLTDVWIKSVLHLLFQHNLSVPEEDLSLSFNNLSQDIGLLLLQLRNLVFELNGLVLKLFKLLLEFILNVEVFA